MEDALDSVVLIDLMIGLRFYYWRKKERNGTKENLWTIRGVLSC